MVAKTTAEAVHSLESMLKGDEASRLAKGARP